MLKKRKLVTCTIAMVLATTLLSPMVANATLFKSGTNGVIVQNNAEQNKNPFRGTEDGNEKLDKSQDMQKLELKEQKIKDGVNTKTSDLVPIIVEFKSQPKVVSKATKTKKSFFSVDKSVENDHKAFKEFLGTDKAKSKVASKANDTSKSNKNENSLSEYTIKNSYVNTFNGVSMKVKGTDVEKLLECNSVKAIWSDVYSQLELPEVSKEKAEIKPFMFDSVPLIGADKLHNEGLKGDGIKVGVIDTGVDYNHPDLKDNYKGGYDFVDYDDDPMETTYEDWLNSGAPEDIFGSTYYTSHGTHVSGTIAANGKNKDTDLAVTGIAPEADLYVYRVLGPYGMGYMSDIMAGVEQAVIDEMDVINLSLGGDLNDPLSPLSVVCNNSMLAGITTVVANGNSGPNSSTVGEPGAADLPISVGASTTAISINRYTIKSGDKSFEGNLFARTFDNSFKDIAAAGKEFKLYDSGFGGSSSDYKAEVKGNIALISRGEYYFEEKLISAKEAGAVAVIIYNNEPGEIPYYLGEQDLIPAIEVSDEIGASLLAIAQSENNTISLEITGETKTDGDILADFSSRGPSGNGNIKPDLVAPGVNIFSTFPEFINNKDGDIDYSKAYSRISGTSMASPHVAGISALILEKNKEYSPFDVKAALMNTCEDLNGNYKVNETGAGRVNAYEAVNSDLKIVVQDIAVNQNNEGEFVNIDYFTGGISYGYKIVTSADVNESNSIYFENKGTSTKNLDITVEFNGEDLGANNAVSNNVKLEIENSLTLGKGETKELNAKLFIPQNAEKGRYEGYINVINKDDSNENYRIPFNVNYIEPSIIAADMTKMVVSSDSEFLNRDFEIGAKGIIGTNLPFKTLKVYFRDFDTDEVIGYRGSIDGTGTLPDNIYLVQGLIDKNASYLPVKDGKVDKKVRRLKEGKYYAEFVFEGVGDKTLSKKVPFIVDNQAAKITIDNFEEGYIKLTDDMYTTESIEGIDERVIWITGKVEDNSLAMLQSMGIDADASSLYLGAYLKGNIGASGFYKNVNPDGTFKLPLRESDIVTYGGSIEFTPFVMDQGGIVNLKAEKKYNFINSNTVYAQTKVDKKEIKEGDKVVSTLSINNSTGASKFRTTVSIPKGFELNGYTLNPSFKEFLNNKKLTATIKDKFSKESGNISLNIFIEISDSNGNPANIAGNYEIFDFTTTLIDDNCIKAYYETPVTNTLEDVINAEWGYEEIAYTAVSDSVKVQVNSSSVEAIVPATGFMLKTNGVVAEKYKDYLWLEDSKGNKYYLDVNSDNGYFCFKNLPITTEEMKLVADLPGHFKREAILTPYRMVDGEIKGKSTTIGIEDFGNIIFAGDANKDNVVDILDLLELEKVYNKDTSGKFSQCDFNGDGFVNINDIDYLVIALTMKNDQADNVKEPEFVDSKGRTLQDVLEALNYFVPRVSEVKLNEEMKTIAVGESFTLTPTILPDDAVNKEFEWIIPKNTEKYVTLDTKTGKITGKAPGFVQIGVETKDGGVYAACFIEITGDENTIYVDNIAVNKSEVSLEVGQSETLVATATPTNAVETSVDWYSSAESIVSVVNGKLQANSTGTALVSAVNKVSGVGTTVKVTVTDKSIKVASVELNKEKLDLKVNGSFKLEATVKPDNATNKDVIWSSSNDAIVKVDNNGQVTALKDGSATITVTTKDGSLTAKCVVKVSKEEEGTNPENPDDTNKEPDKNNNKMPQTGGVNTVYTLIFGALLVITGAFILKKKKVNKQEE